MPTPNELIAAFAPGLVGRLTAPVDLAPISGTMRSFDPAPTQRLKWAGQDILMALGADPYAAGRLSGNLADLAVMGTPLGIPLGVLDAQHAAGQGDVLGTTVGAMAGIPGGKFVKPKTAKEGLDAAVAAVKATLGGGKVVETPGKVDPVEQALFEIQQALSLSGAAQQPPQPKSVQAFIPPAPEVPKKPVPVADLQELGTVAPAPKKSWADIVKQKAGAKAEPPPLPEGVPLSAWQPIKQSPWPDPADVFAQKPWTNIHSEGEYPVETIDKVLDWMVTEKSKPELIQKVMDDPKTFKEWFNVYNSMGPGKADIPDLNDKKNVAIEYLASKHWDKQTIKEALADPNVLDYWYVLAKDEKKANAPTLATKFDPAVFGEPAKAAPDKTKPASVAPAVAMGGAETANFQIPLGWKQFGKQGGYNPGGFFESPKGSQWYLKQTPSDEHLRSEMLANELYALAGAEVPMLARVDVSGSGKLLGSELVGNQFKELGMVNSPETLAAAEEKIRRAFAVDAWLNNRDVIGPMRNNVLVDPQGNIRRIDQGGALRFGGTGAEKTFGPDVEDVWGILQDPYGKNPSAGSVFKNLTQQEIDAGIAGVYSVPNDTVRALVEKYKLPKEWADLLLERKASLEPRYKGGAPLPKPLEASERAKEAGFATSQFADPEIGGTWYHGSSTIFPTYRADFAANEPAYFLTRDPQIAAQGYGANVLPHYVRKGDYAIMDIGGKYYDGFTFRTAIDQARGEGKTGVLFKNVRDIGSDAPHDQLALVDSSAARHTWAKFDPTQLASPRLALGLGGAGVLAPGLVGQDEANAQPSLLDILAALGLPR